MIIVRFKGGVGNQMFQYAAGRALAARLGVPLAFDTRWYAHPAHQLAVARTFDLRHFAVQGEPAVAEELRKFYYSGDQSWPVRWLRRLGRSLGGRTVWVEERPGYFPRFEQTGDRTLLEGYFQDPRYFAAIQPQLREEFRLGVPPPAAAQDFAARLSAEPSVCIQVRRTDLVSNPSARAVHGVCDQGYFSRAWAILQERVPEARGYVFADDSGWAQDAFRGWPGVTIVGPEWDGPAYLHKFFLMQACRHFIMANSTWGWWAAWLGHSAGKQVVMPRQWFTDPVANEAANGLALPGWLRC